MKRRDVIQKIIDKKKARTYLEIGLGGGRNFFKIKAPYKIAVDPKFDFTGTYRFKWTIKNLCNVRARFYECTSDQYFAFKKPTLRYDVIFVDGLHTYKQSLRDVMNSLDSLNDTGVIVMHDCNPQNEAVAYPAESLEHAATLNIPGWTDRWTGDVWKTICYLRSQRRDLKIFTFDFDYGLGIVTRGKADTYLNLSEKQLDKMTYADLERDRRNLLNLKDENYLPIFLESI